MSACNFPVHTETDYEANVKTYLAFDQAGIYNIFGTDAGALDEENCKSVSDTWCGFAGLGGQPMPVKSLMQFSQICLLYTSPSPRD